MMEHEAAITAAERLNDGVLIRFEDGRYVLYSAALLYQLIPQAQERDETAPDW
jgi:hypothetical protein